MGAEQLFVAVGAVQLHRANGARIAPRGGNQASATDSSGNKRSYRAVLLLLEHHVLQPFRKEALYVVVDSGGAAEYLGVARPATALVTLGTIGGHVDKVTPLAPYRIAVKSVQLLVSALEKARAAHIRIYSDGSYILEPYLGVGIFVEPYITEALEGKGGLKKVFAICEHISIQILCGTHILGVEIAILVKHLGVGYDDPLARLTADAEFRIAGNILTEIYYSLALRGYYKLFGGYPLALDDVLASLRDKHGSFIGVEKGVTEQLYRCRHIHRLTVVYLAVEYMRAANLPGLVRNYPLALAVLVLYIY